ncbi:MAG: carboxypeptidase-like regulatory domain-containing protein [Candidatus Acidiferrales bacterium]
MNQERGNCRKIVSNAIIGLMLLVGLALVCAQSARAQTNQGAIAGNVLDASGAVVPNVKIVATNTTTGATYQTVSTSAGAYRFPNLTVGPYDITAKGSGFKVATLHGVIVEVATTASLDIKLAAGSVNETVTVNADTPRIQTETSEIGTVVTQQQVLDLPLVLGSSVQYMRSPEAFVFLIPGTVGPGTGNGNGGTFESKIAGGQNYATEVLLDGASMFRSENGSSFDETAPSVEALSEFKVLVSTIPAEYGRTTGGIETFSTKGGTNSFHGDAYDLFRNEDMDANSWGNNYYGIPRNRDRQNDYGFTIGGPVWIPHLYDGRNKTFFFFSWEQYRQTQGLTTTSTVPTQAEIGGDFSASLNTAVVLGTNPCDGTPIYQGEIFDPTTTRTVGTTQCRTAFMNEPGSTGNVIPTGLITTVAKNVLSYYPVPTNDNLINNYTYQYSFPTLATTPTFRIDENIGEKNKLYFTYSSRQNSRISTTAFFANAAGDGRDQLFTTHYERFGWDYVITPSILNHFNIGLNRTNSANIGAGVRYGGGSDWDTKLGITGASGPMFPAFGFFQTSPYVGLGDNVYGDTIDNGLRTSDTVSWIKGKHEMKFGVDWRFQQFSPLNYQNTSGSYYFWAAQTAGTSNLNTGQTGDPIASILLGDVHDSNLSAYASQPRWLRSYFGFFAQDSYKVTPTLTVNYGLRWDIDQPNKENFDATSNIGITTPNTAAGGLPGALIFAGKGAGRTGVTGERWAETYMKDFGPRLGFAWSPGILGHDTVIRGGYGIIYAPIQYADFGGFMRTGFQANPAFSSADNFNPAFNLTNGFPAYPAPPNLDPTQANFTGPDYIAKSYGRPGMIQNWSLEVQRQLASDWILSVAYVGQHSTHLRSNFDAVNSLNPQYFSMGGVLSQPISVAGVAPPFAGFPGGNTVAQTLIPFPQYYGFNTDGALENLGQATYNALQAQLQHRFHYGLNLMASYTWSKTLTDADSALPYFATLAGSAGPQDYFNQKGDKAISDQDLPQNFILSYVYELPIGQGKRFLANTGKASRLVSGWSISGVQRYESGQPFAICCATGIPAFAGSIRYDQVPGTSLLSSAFKSGSFNPGTDPMLNINALSDPNNPCVIFTGCTGAPTGAPYSLGTMPRVTGAIRMPDYDSEDFNIMKRTKITEGTDILLQASAINAFNRHVFNRPTDFNIYDTSGFGKLNPSSLLLGPRVLQMQLKFEF